MPNQGNWHNCPVANSCQSGKFQVSSSYRYKRPSEPHTFYRTAREVQRIWRLLHRLHRCAQCVARSGTAVVPDIATVTIARCDQVGEARKIVTKSCALLTGRVRT